MAHGDLLELWVLASSALLQFRSIGPPGRRKLSMCHVVMDLRYLSRMRRGSVGTVQITPPLPYL